MIVSIILIVFGVFSLGDILLMIKGPTIFDRLLFFSVLSAKIVITITLLALVTGHGYILDIAISYTLLSFVSTVLIARFVCGRGNLS